MYWVVTVPGQKLRCHGVADKGRAPVALIRRRTLVDGSRSLLAQGYTLGQTVAPELLAAQGVTVLLAHARYEAEAELQRLWAEGWSVQAEELGEYVLRGDPDRMPQEAFPGVELVYGEGETLFFAQLRWGVPGQPLAPLPVERLLRVGIPQRVVSLLKRQGIVTVGELEQAIRRKAISLPEAEGRFLARAFGGEEVLPFRPWRPPFQVVRAYQGENPIERRDQLSAILRRLGEEAFAELWAKGMGVEEFECSLYGEGRSWTCGRRFPEAAGLARWQGLLAAEIARLSVDAPVEQVVLSCRGAPLVSGQSGLFGRVRRGAPLPVNEAVRPIRERREWRLLFHDPFLWQTSGRLDDG